MKKRLCFGRPVSLLKIACQLLSLVCCAIVQSYNPISLIRINYKFPVFLIRINDKKSHIYKRVFLSLSFTLASLHKAVGIYCFMRLIHSAISSSTFWDIVSFIAP